MQKMIVQFKLKYSYKFRTKIQIIYVLIWFIDLNYKKNLINKKTN